MIISGSTKFHISTTKSRDITLSTKVCLVKAMVFPVVMYGCESWTIKKAECQRIDAFELRCWGRLLRALCTARRSNQSILKDIRPGCSLWKVVAEPHKNARVLGLQNRRIQSGARNEAWSFRALCNKVLLKYKGDRESFWHRHQKGAERVPLC